MKVQIIIAVPARSNLLGAAIITRPCEFEECMSSVRYYGITITRTYDAMRDCHTHPTVRTEYNYTITGLLTTLQHLDCVTRSALFVTEERGDERGYSLGTSYQSLPSRVLFIKRKATTLQTCMTKKKQKTLLSGVNRRRCILL